MALLSLLLLVGSSGCNGGTAASSALARFPLAPPASASAPVPAPSGKVDRTTRYVPNYSHDLANARRWDKETITVHITPPPADSGAVARDYKALVRKGISLWVPHSRSFIGVRYVEQAADADVAVSFVPSGSLPEGAVGRTEVTFRDRDNVLVAATVRIDWTLNDDSLAQVSTHEMGHAFGLEGHSTDRGDLMYTRVHLPAVITTRDANTLSWNYALDPHRASAAPGAQPKLAASEKLSTYAAACHLDDSHDNAHH